MTSGRAAALLLCAIPATLIVACRQDTTSVSRSTEPSGSASVATTGTLRLPPDLAGFGFGQAKTPADRAIAINTITMCVDGGPAQITAIEPKEADGLALVDWGVRPYPPPGEDMGTWRGKVLDDPTFTQDPVSTSCAGKGHTELDISAKRSSPVGTLKGFYIVSGDTKLFVPMRIALCAQTCPDGVLD